MLLLKLKKISIRIKEMKKNIALIATVLSGLALIALIFGLFHSVKTGSGGSHDKAKTSSLNLKSAKTTAADDKRNVASPFTKDSENTIEFTAESLQEAILKINILNEILKAKNDNDPRLDSEFRELSKAAKNLMKARYAELPDEERNDRGTIVYLLGRNLKSPEDFEFLCNVLKEPPCLSLQNCGQPPPNQSGRHKEYDHDSAEAVTKAYPQHVALKSIERWAAANSPVRSHALWPAAAAALGCAAQSKLQAIAEQGQGLRTQLEQSAPNH